MVGVVWVVVGVVQEVMGVVWVVVGGNGWDLGVVSVVVGHCLLSSQKLCASLI